MVHLTAARLAPHPLKQTSVLSVVVVKQFLFNHLAGTLGCLVSATRSAALAHVLTVGISDDGGTRCNRHESSLALLHRTKRASGGDEVTTLCVLHVARAF